MSVEFGSDAAMKWERVSPPFHWKKAGKMIVADRHLPDGTRQHMVEGSVVLGLVIGNAQIIGEDDVINAEFSEKQSHLSM